jgi:prepilin-type N-terminal cleavage/methylation domain-containing protein
VTVGRLAGRADGWRGITLPELLVVVSIIGLAVTVSVPAINHAIRSAHLRTAVEQYVHSLQAARMIAVTRQEDVQVTIAAHPDNSYEYVDINGRTRTVSLPRGVCIMDATSTVVTFRPNGSVDPMATTSLTSIRRVGTNELCDLSGDHAEGWEINTNLLGRTSVSEHVRN